MLDKKYDFKTVEKELQAFWENNKVYAFNVTDPGEIYAIDTPPPTVSGKIHIGHIFSYTQAEMIARYQRMQGKNVFYPFGFDDNGLPTERLVERDLNIIAKEMDRHAFIDQCLKATKKYEAEFQELWTSMGFSCDWQQSYRTIDESSQRISQRSFIELVKDKKAYQEESPVLWCPHCQTSIAQAELESKEIPSYFNTIKFKVGKKELLIATTRPELLYGCVAIFVHPEDERYQSMHHQACRVPLYGFEVTILPDENVDMTKGTGAVMCCTFGDTTDLEWYKNYDLPYRSVLQENGHIADDVPYIGGMYVTMARKTILERLKEEELLLDTIKISHSVSTHERCGTAIEILPSRQWYIDILSHRQAYLEMADQIEWHPSHMKKRYITWVENLKWNWCISRQRFYGVPIPVWYCKACGEVKLPEDHELPINPIMDKPSTPCACGHHDFEGESAVLDTWATSSVTPQINSKWGEDNERDYLQPMALRTQAHEIIRTWAFYTMVKSYEHHQSIPWEHIMISGFVLAKKGEKFSKSKNNAKMDPQSLIESYSADAIRYWTASGRLGTDMMFEEGELKLSKRFLTKLWNASRFSIMQLSDFTSSDLGLIKPRDQWIVNRYHTCLNQAKAYLETYEVGLARQVMDDFFWKDFCDNYLEYAKDRLYKTELYAHDDVQSGRQALYYVTRGILKLYSIFVPHMTEFIYQKFFRQYEAALSIHKLQWDDALTEGAEEAELIKEILQQIRRFKTERNLSMKDSLHQVSIKTSKTDFLRACQEDIMACCHLGALEIQEESQLEILIEQ